VRTNEQYTDTVMRPHVNADLTVASAVGKTVLHISCLLPRGFHLMKNWNCFDAACDAGIQPGSLTQADIDTYYATHLAHQRQAVRAFLIWAAGHGHIPARRDIPRQEPSTGQVITQRRRLGLLRRFATDTTIPIRPRAAACLLLLYAQPLSRILQLTDADLTRDVGGQTWLRLGDPPSPVPAPFDELLHQLAASRHDHTPANHASSWLFPGRHAGQPASYRGMLIQLRALGLPLRTARITALRQLVPAVPAPVIADADLPGGGHTELPGGDQRDYLVVAAVHGGGAQVADLRDYRYPRSCAYRRARMIILRCRVGR
jgi:hypothetical protein